MLLFEFLRYSVKFLSSLNVYVIFRQVNRLSSNDAPGSRMAYAAHSPSDHQLHCLTISEASIYFFK